MERSFERVTLRYERQAARVCEQVSIEGEATLPGSMRDAVTVLSVQAQAHITGVQAAQGQIGVRGRVGFQVLYTQGDLTRIRVIETTCDFTHSVAAAGAAPGMRAEATVCVRETNGVSGSGRLSLGAQLEICAGAYELAETEALAAVEPDAQLCTRRQTVTLSTCERLGEETTLVREEFDLPQRLGVGDVLAATGTATVTDVTGGSGRVGVSGVVEMRVLHRSAAPGEALVETTHEAPFQATIPAQIREGMTPTAHAEVIDVMADSTEGEKSRTMRAEAEIRVQLWGGQEAQAALLEDLYATDGPALEPRTQEVELHAARECGSARESVRVRAALPADAPPMEKALAAFARPLMCEYEGMGRRTKAEGVMEVTLLYLPVDSDIPCSVRVREPFSMAFPIEMQADAEAALEVIECAVGPATSDAAELRCVLSMRARAHATQRVRIVTDVETGEQTPMAHGFVLVWPAPGETRWETARRLRVREEKLMPAGQGALMAFRR